MDIASPITAVKGIGEKTQKAFAKMGVYTVGDILVHFPGLCKVSGNNGY